MKLLIVAIGLLTMPFVKASINIAEGQEFSWNIDIIEDPKQEVNMTYTIINDSLIEFTLYEHPDSTTKNNYRWNLAVCGLQDLYYYEEDAQGGFSNSQRLQGAAYGNLTFYGMNQTWCEQQGNSGWPLFSQGSKQQFPKTFRLEVPPTVDFTMHAGTGSVTIGATYVADAIYPGWTENLCTSPDGRLHGVIKDGNSDPYYIYSDNNGATFTEDGAILATTIEEPGITCLTNGSIFIHYRLSTSLLLIQSTDNGATWDSPVTALTSIALGDCHGYTNEMHCVEGSNGGIYVTSADGYTTQTELTTSTDDIDMATVRVDKNNNAHVVGIGTDGDDIMYWSNLANGFGRTNHISIFEDTSWSSNQGEDPTIAISDNGTLGICYVDNSDADLVICDSSVNDAANWNCDDDVLVGTYDDASATFSGRNQFYCTVQSGNNIIRINTTDFNTYQTDTYLTTNMDYSSITGGNGIIHLLYDEATSIKYTNFSTQTNIVYSMVFDYPTSSNQLNTASGNKELIGFKFLADDTDITTGISAINFSIDNSIAEVFEVSQGFVTTYYDYTTEFDGTSSTATQCNGFGAIDVPETSYPPSCPSTSDISLQSELDNSDDSRYQTSASGSNGNFGQYFTWNIDQDKASIRQLNVTWEGYSPAIDFITFSMYDYDTSSYTLLETSSTINSDTTKVYILNSTKYVSSSGEVLFVIKVDSDGGVDSIYTDYVNISIGYEDINRDFSFNGSTWTANITTPTKSDGTYSIFGNVTYNGEVYNATSLASCVYGSGPSDSCNPSTPLTAEHIFLGSDNCVTNGFDAGGYGVSCVGDGSLTMNGAIYNHGGYSSHACVTACHGTGNCFG